MLHVAAKSPPPSKSCLFIPSHVPARYWCRHCHNEAEESVAALRSIPPTSHSLDRYAVKEASARNLAHPLSQPLFGLITWIITRCFECVFRLTVKEQVVCAQCNTRQPVSNNCTSCGIQFGIRNVCTRRSFCSHITQASIFAPFATFGTTERKRRSTTTATVAACVV